MKHPSDKVLVQKKVNKGARIIPLNNRQIPIAIAMENFNEGSVGVLNFDVTYPLVFNNRLISLPGLKKIHNNNKRRKKKYGKKRRRPTSKKD